LLFNRSALPPLVVLAVLIGLWAALVRVLDVDPSVVPAPDVVVRVTWEDRASVWPALLATTKVALLGTALAVVVALLAAVAVDWSTTVRRSVYPLLVASQTIPIIALAPLVVIWFGLTAAPKVALCALFTFFAIVVGTVQGLASADSEAQDLLRTMGASRVQVLLRVRVPSAVPSFFTGLKVAVTYAFSAAIVTEYIGTEQGLGVYINAANRALRTDLVFGGVLVTALLTLILFGAVLVLERLAMPYRRPDREEGRW
jgi:ABC-type nitrate/sulfonate/bicarbonate transport system permease component